jgi:hypothetical protein
MSTSSRKPKQETSAVDAATINTTAEGVVDVGDEVYVSPTMQAVLAGDPVIFDMNVGEEAYRPVEGE